MTTDSRSWMSYPPHEYFRRALCDLFGREVEAGELPADEELVGNMIERICYGNAKQYFNFPDLQPAPRPAGATVHTNE